MSTTLTTGEVGDLSMADLDDVLDEIVDELAMDGDASLAHQGSPLTGSAATEPATAGSSDSTTPVDTAVAGTTTATTTAATTAGDSSDEDTVATQVLLKHCLVNPGEEQQKVIVTHIASMLKEQGGEGIFTIGASEIEDDGISEEDVAASVEMLSTLAESCNADVTVLRKATADKGSLADCLIRQRAGPTDFSEVRIAVVGNVDAGKSTMLGVLTHGVLDNGRGLSRQQLFRHQHEIDSGRTSSVSYDIMGFNSKGEIVNAPQHDGKLDWIQICNDASKVATFIDLAGHERYLKTTVFGLTGHAPHYAMLMIGANAGIVGMTKEHLGLALALNVPVYVVVTKIDMCPPNVLKSNMKILTKILRTPGVRKIPMLVETMDDVIVAASNFLSSRTCPIFKVSNVTGENIDLVKAFLNLLKQPIVAGEFEPTEYQIDDTFSVPGVGTVVSGYVRQGVVRPNDTLLLGPDALGKFRSATIKGIHRRRMPTTEVRAGQTASFALKKIKRAEIRKGMVLVAKELAPKATWEFEGEIVVLHHPTTISTKYQAMVHCGSIRQTATIVKLSKEHIRTGDKAIASFRFIRNPELLHIGQKIIFREGRTKAIGTVTRLLS